MQILIIFFLKAKLPFQIWVFYWDQLVKKHKQEVVSAGHDGPFCSLFDAFSFYYLKKSDTLFLSEIYFHWTMPSCTVWMNIHGHSSLFFCSESFVEQRLPTAWKVILLETLKWLFD